MRDANNQATDPPSNQLKYSASDRTVFINAVCSNLKENVDKPVNFLPNTNTFVENLLNIMSIKMSSKIKSNLS